MPSEEGTSIRTSCSKCTTTTRTRRAVGKNMDDKPHSNVKLEPCALEGLLDHSGVRFLVTPKLRRFDAGIMELGLIYSDAMAIPPGQSHFALHGFCLPQCTEQVVNRGRRQAACRSACLFVAAAHARHRRGSQHQALQERRRAPGGQQGRPLLRTLPGDQAARQTQQDLASK